MKTLINTIIIILAFTATIFASPVSNYTVRDNVTLKKTLKLTDEQNEDLMFFYNMLNSNIDSAMCEHDSVVKSRMLENAIKINTTNAKMILNHEQYHKYLQLLNATLTNKNIKTQNNS